MYARRPGNAWLVESPTEPGGEVGVAGEDGLHRVAQPLRVQRPGDGDVELHRVEIVEIPSGIGVEEQALLKGCER